MTKKIIYIVVALVVLEVLREILRFRKKKRIERSGELSRWALERYIDFKKLAILIVIGVGIYFSLPLIRKYLIPDIQNMEWLFNRQLLYLFVKVIGAIVIMEIVYKLILMKLFSSVSALWSRLIRYFYWGVIVYLIVGLWPFGKIAIDKAKEAVNKPYEARTEEERQQVDKIKEMRSKMKELKEMQQDRQYESVE